MGRMIRRTLPSLAVAALPLLLVVCSAEPAYQAPKSASYGIMPDPDTRIGRHVGPRQAEQGERSGFVLLTSGMDAFVVRMVLTRTADRTLDIQTYILREDDSGRLLLHAFMEAADRGVRVRLLLDDQNLSGLDKTLARLDAHPNVAVRLFNPYAGRSFWERTGALITDFSRISRRMHNKFFAADNWLAVVGGRNIGDEYHEARPELDFLDMDVLAAGPVVRKLTERSFDAYWNSRWAVPLAAFGLAAPVPAAIDRWRRELAGHAATMRDSAYAEALRHTPLITQIREGALDMAWGDAEVVVDDPAKIDAARAASRRLPRLFEQVAEEMRGTREELLLVSPYFVPGELGVRFLGALAERGVTVRVLTNSLSTTDSIAAFAGYHAYRRELIRAGVELYELKSSAASIRRLRDSVGRGSSQASLHAKTFIMDRRRVVIGSLNLDPRSVWINTETALFVDNAELSRSVARMFDEAATPASSYRVLLGAVEAGVDGNYVSQLVWRTEEDGRMVDYDHEPEVSIPRKLAVILLRMLPIEDQL